MEIVKRAIRLMHEGKCIYDQFQLDEDYNVRMQRRMWEM